MTRLRAIVVLGLLASAAPAADPPKPAPSKGAAAAVEVRLADGSSVRMNLTQPHVEIVTKYGKLAIPAHEVRRVEFGFRYPEGAEAKITELVNRLGDGNYKRREAAAADLLAYKEIAYPALKRATKSSDAETAKRAAELVGKLEDKLPAETLKFREFDVVSAIDFTARGQIESKTLQGYTPYFGDVSLQVAEVRSLRSVALGGEATVQVDAARYADNRTADWLDTDMELTGDTPVEIVATGTIQLHPGAGYEAGPKGHPSYSSGMHPAGMLLGRVGSSGEVFVIGEKYQGTPRERGKLYLRIAPSPWPGQTSGQFKVTITLNPVR
ncbi:MAG TPA: hypothetical protein VKE40_08820 [Gemmataceae bacterium]|nr:hypothetical protein [Gemmataceae bacterium]